MRPRNDSVNAVGRIVFYLLLAAYIVLTLAQRAFPTQDGPAHLYYADVVRHMLRGDGVYSAYFAIKHWFPPYAFHTYLLIGLFSMAKALTAEKILVTIYTVWFCIAFRYLIHSVNPADEVFTLAAFPFVHNKTVYLGFYNFSFGVATCLFLIGYWLRHYRRLTAARAAIFGCVILVLAMMHPVALFVALLFVGTHVALMALAEYRQAPGASAARALAAMGRVRRQALLVGAAGVCSALWILQFTRGGGLIWNLAPMRPLALLAMAPLTAFRPIAYRLVLAFPAAAVTLLALRRLLAGGFLKPLTEEAALMVLAFGCAAIYMFGPFQVNYGAFFPDRFPIFAVAFAAAFASGLELEARPQQCMMTGVAAAAVICLITQGVLKQRIIDNLEPVYDAAAAQSARKVLVVSTEPISNTSAAPDSFDPYLWAGLNYVRRSKAIFLNSAWLDTPITMLGSRTRHMCSYEDPFPTSLCLSGNPKARHAGPAPEPDLLISIDHGGNSGERISTERLARSMGMRPLPLRAGVLSFYARPGRNATMASPGRRH
jgi:hypothetical protein